MKHPGHHLAAGLAKIGLVLRHHAWETGERAGLHPTQSQVLAVLGAHGPRGLSVSELAGELAISSPTVSDSVSALERKGLVKKVRSDEDARVVLVRLSASGRRRAAQAAAWPDFLLAAIDSLDPAERGIFVRGLVKMIGHLQQVGRIPTARMCPSCTYFRPWAHPGEDLPHHCAYVDSAIGDGQVRIDCPDHARVDPRDGMRLWDVFIKGMPPVGASPTRTDATAPGSEGDSP